MPERDLLVGALVAELLGPRSGPRESLPPDQDPLDEYITGVLAPHRVPAVEIDAEDDAVSGETSSADDHSDPGAAVMPSANINVLPSPTLDPRSRPASLGLSFSVDGANPTIDLCCTWARYRQAEGGAWAREPFGETWSAVPCVADRVISPHRDPRLHVHLRCRADGTRWRVSIFIVNATPVAGDRAGTEDHVFQPQIRVRCGDGTRLLPIDEERARRGDDQEHELSLLYRDRRAFARGHQCSAVWREIDPERQHPAAQLPEYGPFWWADGHELFDEVACGRFSPADVRTEYVPVVPVNAPAKTWPADWPAPELHPERLAELWNPEALDAALTPLEVGYGRWLQEREVEAVALGADERTVAERNLSSCRRVHTRIRAGIDLLVRDDAARLAFCFANRAIADQSRWTKGRVNTWWPFQLAFQLVNLPALADRDHADRDICDLLWFPTGGGKTEAYLGLAAFTMAYRRIAARRGGLDHGGAGVAVLSRYTLRLLTIQQFRRALAVVTACEKLRVDRSRGAVGWRPTACADGTDGIWGGARFSVGLWVGGGVTPNSLQDFTYKDRQGRLVTIRGALSLLEGRGDGDGEPAQVLNCPACSATLAVSPDGYQRGETAILHLVLGDAARVSPLPSHAELSSPPFNVTAASFTPHHNRRYGTLRLAIAFTDAVRPENIDEWFRDQVVRTMGPDTWLGASRASRPGYFIRSLRWGRSRSDKPVEFEIFCPNPECDLNRDVEWEESTPTGHWPVRDAFVGASGRMTRCPIPAWTIDEQVYQWCPSMVVATVDKFARLAFEPRAATLFGNVERYNEHLGWYRRGCVPQGPSTSLPSRPLVDPTFGQNVPTSRLTPPDFILQDELHLIEGPLGSMVGLYEAGVDMLASQAGEQRRTHAKYVASTATVRNADAQVRSLYLRDLQVFPPPCLSVDDSFFARTDRAHPLDATSAGRLYVGVCAPGRGAQTPIVRIWSRLLQHLQDRRGAGAPDSALDPFWTLVGYFNAVRELAGAVALTRQDIWQRLSTIGAPPRELDSDDPMELSSRADSMRLPGMLGHLQSSLGGATPPVNVVAATSMFGTGVDVDRLGLMVVHGQPKTTSSYIQATGRVGRQTGGLVVTFFRASRPRDLNHYEFFCAYHSALYRFVEPVTVNPFAPRARDRGLGPVAVALLRQSADVEGRAGTVPVHERWRVQQRVAGPPRFHCRAGEMSQARRDADVEALPPLLEGRSQQQPGLRRPRAGDTQDHAVSELDVWQQLAARAPGLLVYYEPTLINPPSRPVVLGDLAHEVARTGVAYEDAPNSLRDVESTVTVRGWR